MSVENTCLLVGAALSAIAALAHVGAIIFGAHWYRFLGAGEGVVGMVEAGRAYPAAITAIIAGVLMISSLYALSGAGIVGELPFPRTMLCAITAMYLVRAVGFIPLMKLMPGNSLKFWLVSSGICLVFGVVHLMGLRQAWADL